MTLNRLSVNRCQLSETATATLDSQHIVARTSTYVKKYSSARELFHLDRSKASAAAVHESCHPDISKRGGNVAPQGCI